MDKAYLSEVDALLNELKIPFSYIGRNYITQALLLLLQSPHGSSAGPLYSQVAEICHTTYDGVERNIRNCFNKLDYSSDLAIRLFPVRSKTGAVKPKEGLYALLSELKQRLSD